MLLQSLMQGRRAEKAMADALDQYRENALAEALSGSPSIVGSFSKTLYPHDGGHRIEYKMGDTLLVEEIRIHDEYTFHIHGQK